ncbi:Tfb4-domain-containing protein [Guyanagaster necrorhizus]|uniref:General transcription and DNA repair factor IIH subunit TFB4 n=1 Tax=Guyanagaster necrorhizus TaxID=856835 RepID=A0A9P7VSU7_9AGAR|nr:Tfb4-domain-containing protein [Guyanagaster necrorhizus MCA 3950]KAG7446289.1 Tfb4-domain-containing protein [Guyanagaster necrorhizus MCA 3950]
MDDSTGSHLSVVVDLSPTQWHLSGHSSNAYPLALNSFLSQLLVFLNAHLASKHENTLAVFGALPGKSVMLYSSIDQEVGATMQMDSNSYLAFKMVDSAIVRSIRDELDVLMDDEEEAPCGLVGALTKALCYVNRVALASTSDNSSQSLEAGSSTDPRILILSVSPDLTTSYIPIMNAIFSAQKLKVAVDACQIYGTDSVFLQQAAHLTGGSYISLERRDALLQYLIMSFLSPPSIRKVLSVPTQDRIDFRAACFCHKNIIDIGFVCSVCLSIFCQPVPVCSTCRTKFPIKTLQRLNAAKPLLAQSNGSVERTPSSSQPPTPSHSGSVAPFSGHNGNTSYQSLHSASIGQGNSNGTNGARQGPG